MKCSVCTFPVLNLDCLWIERIKEQLTLQFFCQAKSILPFLRFWHLKVCMEYIFVCLHVCLTPLKLTLVINLLVDASANFRNSDFSFVLLKYCAIFP